MLEWAEVAATLDVDVCVAVEVGAASKTGQGGRREEVKRRFVEIVMLQPLQRISKDVHTSDEEILASWRAFFIYVWLAETIEPTSIHSRNTRGYTHSRGNASRKAKPELETRGHMLVVWGARGGDANIRIL